MPKYGSQVDLQNIPIKGLVVEQVTAFPTTGAVEGRKVYRTDLKAEYTYINGTWRRSDAQDKSDANHQHQYRDIVGLADVLDSKAESYHTHDDRYYTETEVDTRLNGKANSAHNHIASEITSGVFDVGRLGQGLQSASAGSLLVRGAANEVTPVPVGAAGQFLKFVGVGSLPVWDTVPIIGDGTTATAGKVRLATVAEAKTGTSESIAVTPAGAKALIDALIAGAPGALDTLDELAAAIGDDQNFRTTILNAIAAKQDNLTAGNGLTKTGATIDIASDWSITVEADRIRLSDAANNIINAKASSTSGSIPALTAGTWVQINVNQAKSLRITEDSTGEEIILDTRYSGGTQVRAHVAYAANTLSYILVY